MCGWKDDKGNVFDIEEIQAPSPYGAKYRYVKDILLEKYPDLKKFTASSLVPYVYVGTSDRILTQKKHKKRPFPDAWF